MKFRRLIPAELSQRVSEVFFGYSVVFYDLKAAAISPRLKRSRLSGGLKRTRRRTDVSSDGIRPRRRLLVNEAQFNLVAVLPFSSC